MKKKRKKDRKEKKEKKAEKRGDDVRESWPAAGVYAGRRRGCVRRSRQRQAKLPTGRAETTDGCLVSLAVTMSRSLATVLAVQRAQLTHRRSTKHDF